MSTTDIELDGSQHGCFHSASRRLRKRRHSETITTDENDTVNVAHQNKSIFTSIKEKLGLKATENVDKKSTVLSSIHNQDGEHNMSYQGKNHPSACVTNKELCVPRKRVKFDEENLIVSSLSYQRGNAIRRQRQQHVEQQTTKKEEESLLTRFINFTANLF